MRTRNPSHQLHAIALLAYLGADDDGPVSIEADPDPERATLRRRLLALSDDARGPLLSDPESALALVSAALDLLDAAQVDARRGPAIDVERRFGKVQKHLDEIVAQLEPGVRLDALEAEVARLRHGLSQEAAEEPEVVRYDEGWTAAVPIDATPKVGGQFPVGTIWVDDGAGYVRVRLPTGWDLAVGTSPPEIGIGPMTVGSPAELAMTDFSPWDTGTVIRLGDGTVPDSWLASHDEVVAIARAWLAERTPAHMDHEPELAHDDGSPF